MQNQLFRAIIADDEASARAVIRGLLQQFFPAIEIVAEASGVKEALQLIRDQKFDLIFLDIELEDGTGFNLLDQLPAMDLNVIFTTAHNEFAIRAFRYNAVDYLLKPIDTDEFKSAVEKALQFKNFDVLRRQFSQLVETTNQNTFERITLTTSDGQVFAKTNDIIRIETYGNYTFVFLAENDRLLVSKNLKDFEEMLPEPEFFRVHQSHIINTAKVKKYVKDDGGYVVMSDNTKIPISRRRKEEFMNAIKK